MNAADELAEAMADAMKPAFEFVLLSDRRRAAHLIAAAITPDLWWRYGLERGWVRPGSVTTSGEVLTWRRVIEKEAPTTTS